MVAQRIERLFEQTAQLWDAALASPRELIVFRLTLLVLLFYGADQPYLELMLRVVAFPMLLSGRLARRPAMWTALAAVEILSSIDAWYIQDNHKFLMAYWTIACCLAAWSDDADRVLAWNGRLLIALAFSFAVLWKFLGGEILSGRFFEFAFLVDPRFESFTLLATGLERSAFAADRAALDSLVAFPAAGRTASLRTNDLVPLAAQAMGWMMVVVEGALALAFWRSFRRPDSELHDWILIAFCAFTYTLTPVVGFGFVLATMGFAQCGEQKRDVRQAYVWTVLLVQFAVHPTFDFVAGLLR